MNLNSDKICKYCEEKLDHYPSSIGIWTTQFSNINGYYSYCSELFDLNKRHEPLTNLDIIERKYNESLNER